jgi:hypothetical protein
VTTHALVVLKTSEGFVMLFMTRKYSCVCVCVFFSNAIAENSSVLMLSEESSLESGPRDLVTTTPRSIEVHISPFQFLAREMQSDFPFPRLLFVSMSFLMLLFS